MLLDNHRLRPEPGHWEADLMYFQGQTACLLICVERWSRLLPATAMTDKSVNTTAQALSGLLEKIPKKPEKPSPWITVANSTSINNCLCAPSSATLILHGSAALSRMLTVSYDEGCPETANLIISQITTLRASQGYTTQHFVSASSF